MAAHAIDVEVRDHPAGSQIDLPEVDANANTAVGRTPLAFAGADVMTVNILTLRRNLIDPYHGIRKIKHYAGLGEKSQPDVADLQGRGTENDGGMEIDTRDVLRLVGDLPAYTARITIRIKGLPAPDASANPYVGRKHEVIGTLELPCDGGSEHSREGHAITVRVETITGYCGGSEDADKNERKKTLHG